MIARVLKTAVEKRYPKDISKKEYLQIKDIKCRTMTNCSNLKV
jgi:hypothetical protein